MTHRSSELYSYVLAGLLKRPALSQRTNEALTALLYLLPAVLLLLVFRILPIILSVRISLYDWRMAGPVQFVGLANYAAVLKDPNFWRSLLNTGWYIVFEVPITLLLSLAIALLLNQPIRGRGVYRTIYYLPVVTSIVAVSVVWKWLLNPDRGLFNYILSLFHINGIRWLQEPRGLFQLLLGPAGDRLPLALRGPSVALLSLVIMGIWKALGYNIIIFLAGLQNIPPTYYEAARVDGAGRWRTFWQITWPLISPTTYYVLIMSCIAAFETFAQVWMMTSPPGGPLGTTKTVMYYFYENSFDYWRLGYGASIAFIAFVIILALTIFQRLFLERRVHYG